MKRKSKILIICISIILFLVLGIFIFVKNYATKSLPDYNSEVLLEGMINEVTIYRDAYAIPHIYAQNETDLYRAVGYVMAQDRLWQMDLIRRVTEGRLSEIFGKEYVETDFMLRALQIEQKSNQVLDSLDDNQKNALVAFADGVNQYVKNNTLPLEFRLIGYKFEDWKPIHSLNIIGFIGWELGPSWNSEILMSEIKNLVDSAKYKALIPDFKDDNYVYETNLDTNKIILAYDFAKENEKIEKLGVIPLMASNNWAISGKKSATKNPILANDMHLSYGIPGMWYQIHQVVENGLDVTGLAIPGCPILIVGHNQNIAWGMTNVMVDDIDFYQETINPNNKNQYKFNGEWKDFKIQKETIKTKEGDSVQRNIYFTHRGAVVSEMKNIKDKTISMRWIGNEYSNEFRSVYLLNRAKNWTDFKDAIKTFVAVSENIAYADKEGNIGIYCAAGVPIRKGDGISIYSGETDEFDWKSFIPFDSLPHEYNPARGYVSSANNKVAPESYPYFITNWSYNDYRINRIREMLEAKDTISIADFEAMQADQKSVMVKKYLADIIFEVSSSDLSDPVMRQSLELLSKWDGTMNKENAAATIFETFYFTLVKNLIQDEIGEEFTNKILSDNKITNNFVEYIWTHKFSYWCDIDSTKDVVEDFSKIVQQTYAETINNLKTKLGDNPMDWQWGQVHTLTLEHPLGKVKILNFVFNLNRGTYAVGGNSHTISPYSYNYSNPYIVKTGSSHRSIYSIANWDESLIILPTGISGQPASKFYCNQTESYLNDKYIPDFFSKDKIVENKKFEMKIKPKN